MAMSKGRLLLVCKQSNGLQKVSDCDLFLKKKIFLKKMNDCSVSS